ncbi:MAG TPA: glycoside hydrolase family 27 protein [Chthoniobacterales bacterium]|nr:glycoside hydrolase family 27 protein [Chthoniobacterales bacterium]
MRTISIPLRRALGLTIGAALLLAGCDRPAPAPTPNSFPILTPPAPSAPRLNGARIFGARPGSPFRFHVSATGERPMEFAAENLPSELTINRADGLITGTLRSRGRQVVRLRVRNRFGAAEKPFTIVGGDTIGLTPPMGWNSWNCWGLKVSEEKVRAAARALAASGLREHGWTYVNIDDGWQGPRGAPLQAIQPNPKFPQIEALAAEVHALGLKLGIYSTPWRISSGRYRGSSADRADGMIELSARIKKFQYQIPKFHSWFENYAWLKPLAEWRREKARKDFQNRLNRFGRFSFVRQDVRQWAAWEIDYLKYDWVPIDLAHVAEMSDTLEASGRDIFYSVSNNAKRTLAPELMKRANAWRTTVDIEDTWESVSNIGFSRDRWAPFNGPGHYNDPDMLVLGETRWHRGSGCRLTADEQYSHMSLWCLLSGPLLLGCDLEKLNPFTLGLLTNDEVLALNQDSLCRQATCVARAGMGRVYAKPLEDGTWGVGLFNLGTKPATIAVQWSDLGLTKPQGVRDLWRQKDLGVFTDRFASPVAPNGVRLIRVGTSSR